MNTSRSNSLKTQPRVPAGHKQGGQWTYALTSGVDHDFPDTEFGGPFTDVVEGTVEGAGPAPIDGSALESIFREEEKPAETDIFDRLRSEDYDERSAAAEEQLLASLRQITSEEEWKEALTFASQVRGYSLPNTILLYAQHHARRKDDPSRPDDPGFFMAKSAWAKLGRYPKAGSRGMAVVSPVTVTVRGYYGRDGKFVTLAGKEKPPAGFEEVKKTFPRRSSEGRMLTKVQCRTFAECDTEGEDIPRLPKPKLLDGETLPGLDETVTQMAQKAGFTVDWVPRDADPVLFSGANGYMDPTAKRIVVCSDLPSPQAKTKTLLHEYGHAMLHDPDNDTTESHKGHRGLKEVQAESVAFMTMKGLADVDTSDYSIPYVANWMTSLPGGQENQYAAVRKALSSVGDVATSVMRAYEESQGKKSI